MSLPQVMLEIADEMDRASSSNGFVHPSDVQSWVKQIRRIVRVCSPQDAAPVKQTDFSIQPQADAMKLTEKLITATNHPAQPEPKVIVTPTGGTVQATGDPWRDALLKAGNASLLAQEERQKREVRTLADVAVRHEENVGAMSVCEGGASDGEYVPTAGMPVDAKTLLSGEVYVMGKDARLHYSEEETRKLLDRTAKRQ